MEGEGSEQQVVKSVTAAHKLGITKTRLNRLAPIYEQVHGELPRGGRHARLWTLDAIERIRSALLAVEEGRALNVEAALRGFETPENTESRHMSVRISGEAPETLAPLSALEELARELHALREVVENQGMLLRDQAYRLKRLETASQLPVTSAEAPKMASLDRMQAHRLKRLETASRLPGTPTEAPKKTSLETLEGTLEGTNNISAEDQKDGEDTGQPSTSRNASLRILLVMLLTLSVVITVISALYMNALLLTVSFVVVVVSLLFSWYYYFYG